jgi:hypothetical protein
VSYWLVNIRDEYARHAPSHNGTWCAISSLPGVREMLDVDHSSAEGLEAFMTEDPEVLEILRTALTRRVQRRPSLGGDGNNTRRWRRLMRQARLPLENTNPSNRKVG